MLNYLIIEIVFYTPLAQIMSIEKTHNSYLKAKVHLDRTTNIVLGGLGLRLVN